ncbi:MAG: TonB-dependent receptor plug domain-containing protein [Polyangia bacterium]
MSRARVLLLLWTALLPAAGALAQEVALPEPVAAPAARADGDLPELALDVDRQIDLANIVTSAAKEVSTVQETPAIVTAIIADEIKARGFRTLQEVLSTVPGWLTVFAGGNEVPNMLVRGVVQSALLLHDGISLFDPWANAANFGRTQPIETLKRIEVVTGPGGVLWGANSFLGIVNLITKDAEDVNGVELSAGYGDGPGNKQDARAWAMFGKSFFGGKLKLFQHVSYESYIGDVYPQQQQGLLSSAVPQPGGPAFTGAPVSIEPPRSWFLSIDGKYTLGPVSIYYAVPLGDNHPTLTFGNTLQNGTTWNNYDRYGVVEYKDSFLRDRFAVDAKAYFVQFVRDYTIQLFPASTIFPAFTDGNGGKNPGGVTFSFDHQFIYRTGGTLDTTITLPHHLRLLVGGEAFYEAASASTEHFISPTDARELPLICPVDAAGVAVSGCPRPLLDAVSRVVAAAYVDAQWHPVPTLALDGGVRYQQGFGGRGYAPQLLYSGALVWSFLSNYHLKASYATGFRAPVFQNTDVPAGGLEYGGSPTLKTESSQAFQGEWNARVLRNVKLVRELELRADYSYTVLSDLIQIRGGSYGNTGKRAIHSVEAYAKLFLRGDHFLQASYTYLHAETTDAGVVRAAPSHWISLGASFNVVPRMLDVNANLLLTTSYLDPNRYPGLSGGIAGATTTLRATDLTFDRLPPVALLQLGFRLRFFRERLNFSAQLYDVLNQHYYHPDPFYDLAPTVEQTPTPAPGFSFFASASYRF